MFVILSVRKILNPALILKQYLKIKKKREKPNYYLVLYHAKDSMLSDSELFSLAKLRAIENRVGVIIFTNKIKLVLKTTKYKQIQLFSEKNGIFGLNKECLGGPESIFTQGIPLQFKEKYMELLDCKR